jgi:tRNA modification GTPase
LNFIADEDIAIVSELAGTTRDIIEIRLDMGGYPVTFFDTAGLRETNNIVEREGVKRARAKADQADIKIVLSDAQLWPELSDGVMGLLDEDSFLLLNKADLMLNKNVLANNVPRETVLQIPCPYYFVSATKGEGFGQFLNDLEFKVIGSLEVGEAPNITRARHRAALEDCQISLLRYLDGPLDPALRAEDLRLASRSLGKITGRVDVEDMLDIVFADFCIGK